MKKRRGVVVDRLLAKKAKSIVVLAFRNGPIENIHAGITCLHCTGKEEYSHITDDEMESAHEKRGEQGP